ncbi:MAG: ADP-ribose pyrophosphatase [Planctomycetota bacterium]|jgi:ADP-ribose pyrophosphatase
MESSPEKDRKVAEKRHAKDAQGHPRDWPLVSSETGPGILVARVRYDVLTNPRTGQDMRRTVLEMPSWVNVVALTPARELVVVQQFRFGTQSVTTEIPGGVVDPGEEPLAAAKRELREETGYSSTRWSLLGAVEPNPAFQDNLCYHYLAEDVMHTHSLELDPGEDIVVGVLGLEVVRARVQSGSIRHSLVLSALARVIDLR